MKFYKLNQSELSDYLKDNIDEFVYESELLKIAFPKKYKSLFNNNYKLYCHHFSLFYSLFELQNKLNQNMFLYVSPLNIGLFNKNPEHCQFFNIKKGFCKNKITNSNYCDKHKFSESVIESTSLKEFYLDKNNLEIITPELLEKMLSGFWKYQNNFENINMYYKLLGLPENSTKPEIKNRFRELCKIYHPDKNTGNINKFRKINTAYRILTQIM